MIRNVVLHTNACYYIFISKIKYRGFPGGAVVKNPPTNSGHAGDVSSTPGLGRSPGEGNGSPL